MNILLNLKKIYYRIKNYLFKKEFMAFDFPNVAVAEIEKKIDLIKKAENDGRNNLPPTNSNVRFQEMSITFNYLLSNKKTRQ